MKIILFYDQVEASGSDYEKMSFVLHADLVKILVGFALTGKMENVFKALIMDIY